MHQEPDQEPDPPQDQEPDPEVAPQDDAHEELLLKRYYEKCEIEKKKRLEFARTRVRHGDSTEQCFDCIDKTSCGTVWINKIQKWKPVCTSCLERFITFRNDRAFWYNEEVYPC